jgi:hypothetical protein
LNIRIASLFVLALCLTFGLPALAQEDLYDNGPVNGQDNAWLISGSSAPALANRVSNSGCCVEGIGNSPNATVNGISFWAWLLPGDTVTSVEVQIGTEAFGNELFDQTINLTASNCFSNQFNFNVCDETGSFSGVNLSPGNYWFTLGNAITPSGDPVYWDQNSGPSEAQDSSVGTIPSESFTIYGSAGTSTTGTTPEPGSILLFGSGLFGLGALLRRKPNL